MRLTNAASTPKASQVPQKPLVHPLFSDHMVLQRSQQVPVWGWAKPGASITVSFAGERAHGKADATGKWLLKLGPLEASSQGRVLTISGPQTIELKGVLVGDVWICSGQSNMEWSVAASKDPHEEIAAADHPGIRLFTVPLLIKSSTRRVKSCVASRVSTPSRCKPSLAFRNSLSKSENS